MDLFVFYLTTIINMFMIMIVLMIQMLFQYILLEVFQVLIITFALLNNILLDKNTFIDNIKHNVHIIQVIISELNLYLLIL